MSTEFAITRFFLPHLTERKGWALFGDSDLLFRGDVRDLFALADDRYAVMVVQHPELDGEGTKMDGAAQLPYRRKNWSSVVLWNLSHPAHDALTLSVLNTWPGRELHAFRWLEDAQIGALPGTWNWLEGYSAPDPDPAVVHLTRGGPWFRNWEHVAWAEAWLAELGRLTLARQAGPPRVPAL